MNIPVRWKEWETEDGEPCWRLVTDGLLERTIASIWFDITSRLYCVPLVHDESQAFPTLKEAKEFIKSEFKIEGGL